MRLTLFILLLLSTACARHYHAETMQGQPGAPGVGCTIEDMVGGALITCGTESVVIVDGTNGRDGVDGADGRDGVDGTDGRDGVDGTDGRDGIDLTPGAYTVTELIDPCGDGPSFDEVLLRLANGQVMAHYAGGGNLQFLTVLAPGSYVTTDQQACRFNVGPAPNYLILY
jgi:hypothetical protein